jgi:hypothetical protein
MPFDQMPVEPKTLTMLQPPYQWGNEKLARLEMLLRNHVDSDRWRWDFERSIHECGTTGCAMGMAIAYGLTTKPAVPGISCDADFHAWHASFGMQLGVPDDVSESLFAGPEIYKVPFHDDVTPLMVANAIRRYMTSGEV